MDDLFYGFGMLLTLFTRPIGAAMLLLAIAIGTGLYIYDKPVKQTEHSVERMARTACSEDETKVAEVYPSEVIKVAQDSEKVRYGVESIFPKAAMVLRAEHGARG